MPGRLLKSPQIYGTEIVYALEGLLTDGIVGATGCALWRRLVHLPIAGNIEIGKAVFRKAGCRTAAIVLNDGHLTSV